MVAVNSFLRVGTDDVEATIVQVTDETFLYHSQDLSSMPLFEHIFQK